MTHFEPEVERNIVKQHIQDGRTYESLANEYGCSRYVIGRLVGNYLKEARRHELESKQIADMETMNRLQKENEELKKENDFLKKAAAFFAKESK